MDDFWDEFNRFVNPFNLVLTPWGVDEQGRKMFRGTQTKEDGTFIEVIVHKPNDETENIEA